MRAHLVQLNLAWEDRDANFRAVEEALDACDPVEGDLVVLPEMFDTGFSFRTERTADREHRTLRFLAGLAEDLGVVIHGGRTVHDCDCAKSENRATIAIPGGRDERGEEGEARIVEYAKIHPFSFGREGEFFRGGDDCVVYPWRSGERAMTVGAAVCYDLRFPELFRRLAEMGAEAFAIGANWPAPRTHHWRALALARAIENQAFVFAVNRCGADPHLAYAGGTIAVGPEGEVLGELGGDEGVLTVEVDPDRVRSWRAKFPALGDRVLGLDARPRASAGCDAGGGRASRGSGGG